MGCCQCELKENLWRESKCFGSDYNRLRLCSLRWSLCHRAIQCAHLNPAVTLGLAVAGKFSWDLIPLYFVAQIIGAMLEQASYLHHLDHYRATEDEATIRIRFVQHQLFEI